MPGVANTDEAVGWTSDGRAVIVAPRTGQPPRLERVDLTTGAHAHPRPSAADWRRPAGLLPQRHARRRPVHLLGHPDGKDAVRREWSETCQARVSPSGDQIAFRSARDGGGLFLTRATGESVRAVDRRGRDPGAGTVWDFNDKKIADGLTRLNLKISVGALEPTTDKK